MAQGDCVATNAHRYRRGWQTGFGDGDQPRRDIGAGSHPRGHSAKWGTKDDTLSRCWPGDFGLDVLPVIYVNYRLYGPVLILSTAEMTRRSGTESSQTRCWRETDSNHRSPIGDHFRDPRSSVRGPPFRERGDRSRRKGEAVPRRRAGGRRYRSGHCHSWHRLWAAAIARADERGVLLRALLNIGFPVRQ
jgi:hypothetical protein